MKKIKKIIFIEENFNKIVPSILHELNEVLDKEEVSLNEVAKVIKKDVIFTAKVIRLANAPFYGFPGRIGSVEEALIILGINTVKIIAYTMCIVDIINTHYKELSNHSLRVAEISKEIGEKLAFSKISEIYTAGLLHDFGKVALKVSEPGYEELKKEAKHKKIPLWIAEEEKFGINHAQIAQKFLDEWMFPKRITIPIAKHHKISSNSPFSKETAIIHIADAIVNVTSPEEIDSFPGFNPEAITLLNISKEELITLLSNSKD